MAKASEVGRALYSSLRDYNSINTCSGFGLVAAEFAAEDGSEDEVVEVVLETVQAKEGGDLSPVANFVEQNVSDDLLRRGAKGAIEEIEFAEGVPFDGGQSVDELLERGASLRAELEKSFGVVVWDGDGIG